jgi:hypothetical protein
VPRPQEGTGLQSEIRTVTVMFLMIDTTSVEAATPGDDFRTLQDAFDFAQSMIVEHEGLIKVWKAGKSQNGLKRDAEVT